MESKRECRGSDEKSEPETRAGICQLREPKPQIHRREPESEHDGRPFSRRQFHMPSCPIWYVARISACCFASPCCPRKAAVPSVPQRPRIAARAPGCKLIHPVRSYTLPLIVTQQLVASLCFETSSIE